MTLGWRLIRRCPDIRRPPVATAGQPRHRHWPAPHAARPGRRRCSGLSRSARSTSAFKAFEWNSAHQSAGSWRPISSRCVLPRPRCTAGCRSAVKAAISRRLGSSKSGPTQDGSPKQRRGPRPSPSLAAALRKAAAHVLVLAMVTSAPCRSLCRWNVSLTIALQPDELRTALRDKKANRNFAPAYSSLLYCRRFGGVLCPMA